MKRSNRNVALRAPLDGRTAVVTGASRNIGRAIATQLALAGASVVANGRDATALEQVVEDIRKVGGNAFPYTADVGNPDEVAAMVAATREHFGAVDIAVSNVAIRPRQPFLKISIGEWHDILNTNLNASFYIARAVLPSMIEAKWGRIIHIAGEDGFAGHVPGRPHNIVSKAGVHALSKAISIEFASYGITANTVSPGAIDTERDWSQYPSGWRQTRLGQIPMGHLGRVEDVALACVFLAGNGGNFITGQVIHVNGGQFMY